MLSCHRRCCCHGDTKKFNVIWVALSFFVQYVAYNSLQNYATSLFPGNIGDESLFILYGSIVVSVFLAPNIVHHLGARTALILSTSCYLLYIAATIYFVDWIILGTSAIIGIGSGIQWTALGEFVKENSSKDSYGQNMGVFWSIFSVNNIVGNLLAYYILIDSNSSGNSSPSDYRVLFTVFTVISAVGTVMLFGLVDADKTTASPETSPSYDSDGAGSVSNASVKTDVSTAPMHKERRSESLNSSSVLPSYHSIIHADLSDLSLMKESDIIPSGESHVGHRYADGRAPASTAEIISTTVSLLVSYESLCLMPMYFFSGAELGFWSGEFPRLLEKKNIGLVMVCLGVGEVLGGYVFGYLSDKHSRTFSVSLGSLFFAGALAGTAVLKASQDAHSMAPPVIDGISLYAFATALAFGLADSSFNTNIFAFIGQIYGDKFATDGGEINAEVIVDTDIDTQAAAFLDEMEPPRSSVKRSVAAYAILQMVQCLGSAYGFGISIYLPYARGGSRMQLYCLGALVVLATGCFILIDRTHNTAK